MKSFSEKLLSWYKKNGRELPWRSTKDPYAIWLSEIILQQTRVEQGSPYFKRFFDECPTVEHLAKSDEKKILKLWQGLGYYSRARNLHYSAKQILSVYGKNGFPKSYDELITFKGIGKYTAAAISSIAFNEQRAAVDGNVYRVLSRIFGVKEPVNSSGGQRVFQALADELICKKKPGDYNQALMDFGSMICSPKKPNCDRCIFTDVCIAHKKDLVTVLPVKIKKLKKTVRFLYFFDVHFKNKRLVKKREDKKDIWYGLYEFPVIELNNQEEENQVLDIFYKKFEVVGSENSTLLFSKKFKHQLSHQNIYASFLTLKLSTLTETLKKDFVLTSSSGLSKYPFPILIVKYLKSLWPEIKIN